MSLHVLASLAFCLSVSRLKYTHGESIAFGKLAKQSNNYPGYPASRSIDPVYWRTGSFAYASNPSWWEVDLRGYFSISNITLTAESYNGWSIYMGNAYVEVMDKDISLCSDVKVEWCGNVSSTVASGEKFTFTCNATFPIRFVRVTRRSGDHYLSIGQVDVQGVGATKRYRSYYTPTANRKVSIPSFTTSAVTAGQCGILCHQNHSCIDFSYSTTASTEANCLLSNKEVPQNSVAKNAWTMYTLDNCL